MNAHARPYSPLTTALIAGLLLAPSLTSAQTPPAKPPAARPPAPPTTATAPAPDVRVGVRPARVRLGETIVVTVRVSAPRMPDEISLDPGESAEVVETKDRTSVGVGSGGAAGVVIERDFLIRPRARGRISLPAVVVALDGRRSEHAIPEIFVADAGVMAAQPPAGAENERTRAERRRESGGAAAAGAEPRAETRGPDPSGRSATAPGSYAMPGSGYGGSAPPYGMPGWTPGFTGSVGVGSWSGLVDPSEWDALIPRLERFEQSVDHPNGLARLEGGVVPKRAYVGQQVTLVATATFPPEAASRLSGPPEFVAARAGDALAVDLPWAPPETAAMRGRTAESHAFMRAFFPVRPGALTIRGPALRFSIGAGGRGRAPLDTLALGGFQVEVLPVPRVGAPASWTGAVGRFAVSARLEPAELSVGQTALLVVEVSGIGEMGAVGRPRLAALPGLDLRPTGERVETEIRDGVVGGRKTFAWLVVPIEGGTIPLGPIPFAYFDPWIGAFGQAFTNETVLRVTGR